MGQLSDCCFVSLLDEAQGGERVDIVGTVSPSAVPLSASKMSEEGLGGCEPPPAWSLSLSHTHTLAPPTSLSRLSEYRTVNGLISDSSLDD